MLADISVRLELKFPYRIKDRIKAVKQIVDRPEYEAYRNDFHRVCNEFPLRGAPLVHGSCIMVLETNPDETSHKFVLQRYESYAKGKFRHHTLNFSIEALRKVAGEMVKYTSDAYAVFHKFYKEQAVETSGHPNA